MLRSNNSGQSIIVSADVSKPEETLDRLQNVCYEGIDCQVTFLTAVHVRAMNVSGQRKGDRSRGCCFDCYLNHES
jgi:hypothetical protein